MAADEDRRDEAKAPGEESADGTAYYRGHGHMSWEDHWVYQLDGRGGRVARPAKLRFLPPYGDRMVYPWGLAAMDNGEIAVAGVAGPMDNTPIPHQTVLAFSRDRGATWSDYVPVEGSENRPMMLAYLGRGVLSFMSSWTEEGAHRFLSHDYGRTWTERVRLPDSPAGNEMSCEGNPHIDRDADGVATRVIETGQTADTGPNHPAGVRGCIRWSSDGGRTFDRFEWPPEWMWQETCEGHTYDRGVGEGGLVRAADGALVAALRTDMPVRFAPLRYDNFEGTAVSISSDEGKTWSGLQPVFGPGRMHANMIRLPNDDLVMTVIRRLHLTPEGRMVSYRRGCDAVVSHDNGRTWDVDHMFILDEFSASGSAQIWYQCVCGHLYSLALEDGSVLTTFGNYHHAGALVLWNPQGA